MKKTLKAAVALMLTTAMCFAVGCGKDDDPNNESEPTTEGIYLGVVGFNDQLYTKGISALNSSTLADFEGFIDGFEARDLTALYYADYVALQKLQSYGEPPKLTNVALVTFTDGLDNLSTDNENVDPEGYGTKPAYRQALHDKIVNTKVHGNSINAYTIGLRGNDVSNSEEFSLNLNALASTSSNVFEVADMSEALQKFAMIAESLYSVTTTVNLTVKIPGGVVDDGQHIRFAFDNGIAPNNSVYIEGVYNKSANPRRLDNLSYHGFQVGASSISSVSNEGGFYFFKFENLNLESGEAISQNVVDRIQMWKETSTGGGWDKESEFKPDNNTTIDEDKSSAIIMLVLDCTTSLGSDFSTMKTAAKRFIETLVSSNGGGNGGGVTTTPTVTTSSVTDITSSSAWCGGNVISEGGSSVTRVGVCWSKSHNPTTSDSYSVSSEWMEGSYNIHMNSLLPSTTYYVRAFAENSAGTGYGQEKSFTTNAAYLPAPTGLKAKISGSSIKLTWNSVPDADWYTVYRACGSGSGSYYLGETWTTTYYDDDPCFENFYKVKAVRQDPDIESEFSNTVYCGYGK